MERAVDLETLLRNAARLTRDASAGTSRDGSDGPRSARRVIAVPMAENEEIIRCIAEASDQMIADFILIGDREKIEKTAAACGVSIGTAEFIPETDPIAACAKAAELASSGKADILMKGLVQTSDFTRAILNHQYRLIDEQRLISHVAVFEIPAYHKILIVTDAAINVAPGLEQKIVLVQNAVWVARSLGISRPNIACVAPSEKVSPKIQSTVDAAEIVRRNEEGALVEQLGDVEIAGPFGFDVAVSTEAAEIKCVASPVAGNADILLLPNLEAGNVLYKSLTLFGGAKVAGIVAGARVPVVLTSRADSEQSKLLSVLLAVAGASMPGQ
ncbi:MAG TPA: phosphate acyltransferase [Spirochaetia bacterium]|nr:phosphate acyltransferase [Spirochaetia bacterium]